MSGNRSALWALLGVALGFGMPVIACAGLALASTIGLALLSGQDGPRAASPTHLSGPASGPAVALIDVTGPIVSGQTGAFDSQRVAASGDIVPLIRQAAANRDVKVLVLRVNSPGGSVVPSDEIYDALRNAGKPVVVLMGEVAASGAYYISMAASHIVANPSTLTGSIGVISEFPNAQELLEKLGVQLTVIKSGPVKDIGSPFRPMEPQERDLWQEIVDETYEGFVAIVAEGRGLPVDEVRRLADGRVFTGRQALELGLVDSLGYENDAIRRASELGGIEGEPRVLHYTRRSSFAALLGARVAALGPSFLSLPPDWLQRVTAPTLEYRWAP